MSEKEERKNSKARFLEFLSKIGVSQSKCTIMCGWSRGYLPALKGDFGADKLATMMKVFPTLNVIWLITGEGSMFNPEPEETKGIEEPKEGTTIPFEVFMQATDRYNKMIAEKDAELEELRRQISILQNKE